MMGRPVPTLDDRSSSKGFFNSLRRFPSDTGFRDPQEAIRLFWRLGFLGFLGSLTIIIALIYLPLVREGEELERHRLNLEQVLREYQNFALTGEIPKIEDVPYVVERYQSELQEKGIIVKGLNIEKIVSNPGTGTSLGYALVRLHCDNHPELPEILQSLESGEKWQVIVEELKLDRHEAYIAFKVYFI